MDDMVDINIPWNEIKWGLMKFAVDQLESTS